MAIQQTTRKVIGGYTSNPYVIHPYYTGRDKGCLCDNEGHPLLFFQPGDAWHHIFFQAQPDDPRAKHNYRVITLKQYQGE